MTLKTLISLAFCLLFTTAQAADYDVDSTFAPDRGLGGWNRFFTTTAVVNEVAVAFARTSDGGYISCLEVANGTGLSKIGLVKFDAAGNRVTSGFGTNGQVVKDAGWIGVVDMTIDPQGRIVVLGRKQGQGGLNDFAVARFNATGGDDPSFGTGGATTAGFDSPGYDSDDAPASVLAQADGKIVVAGTVIYTGSLSRVGALRLNVDGSVDSTFGSIDNLMGGLRGTATVFAEGEAARAVKILRMTGGQFVLVGTSFASPTDRNFGARILFPNGSQFGGTYGSKTIAFDVPNAQGQLFDSASNAVAVDPQTLVIVGSANNAVAATRLVIEPPNNGTGQYSSLSIDPSFIGNQVSVYANRFVSTAMGGSAGLGVAVGPDRRVVIVGNQPISNGASGSVMRLKANGQEDSTLTGSNYVRSYAAPLATANSASLSTVFSGALFDGTQPVLFGTSSFSPTSALFDLDGVIVRLKAESIFATGFESP